MLFNASARHWENVNPQGEEIYVHRANLAGTLIAKTTTEIANPLIKGRVCMSCYGL